MQAAEFIAFARKLLTLPAAMCPAGYRSVTSRLYYGIYHETIDLIEVELGFVHRKNDDNENKHQFILEYLIGSNEEQAQDLASQLRQLHQRRKDADYELSNQRADDESHAIESVVRADRIMNALSACAVDPVRNRIHSGMSSYREKRSGNALRK